MPGPSWSTGRSFVQGSRAIHSHTTWFELRRLVRSSSSCRCGSQRGRKQRSCQVWACSPARVRKAGEGRLPRAEDPFGGGSVQPFGQRREPHCDPAREGVSTETTQCRVEHSTSCGRQGLGRLGSAQHGQACPRQEAAWISDSVIPKDKHFRLGQAKPSGFTRLGAARRLLTS